MAGYKLKLPYPRPQTLSDPGGDFTPDDLASLLAKRDDELNWNDFQCLLGPYLPAGTYEESAYFLPLAFDYILAHDEHAIDLITALVGFTSINALELQRDQCLEAARLQLKRCLDHWTSQFIVKHGDYVWHSETIIEATKDLIEFKRHEDLAIAFYADLAAAESEPVKSAWFLESARANVARGMMRPPRRKEILQFLEDRELVFRHIDIVSASLPEFDYEATYWQNAFALLYTIGEA